MNFLRAFSIAAIFLALPAAAAIIGVEQFDYPDGPLAGQSGGSLWNFNNTTPTSYSGMASNWDDIFAGGSTTISNSRLVTSNNGWAKREYNGANESDGAINDANAAKSVYARVTVTTGATLPNYLGIASYDFGIERLFLGKRSGGNTFGYEISGGASASSAFTVPVNTTFTLVFRLDFAANGISLFLNPNLNLPMTNPANTVPGTLVANAIYNGTNWSTALRLASGSGGDPVIWDDLIIANSWEELGGTVVNTTADEDNGNLGGGEGISLREAVRYSPAGTVISFASNLSGGTLILDPTWGQILLLEPSITIDATALSGGLTVSGNNTSRHFFVPPGKSLTLRGLTLRGGNCSANVGGSIANLGMLNLHRCTLTENASNSVGGAIYSAGTLRAFDCSFSGNTASDGGALWQQDSATATLSHCTVVENHSTGANTTGGIKAINGNLTILHSTISLNNGNGGGGGLNLQNPAVVSLSNSIIAGNSDLGSNRPDIVDSHNTLISSGTNLIGNNTGVSVRLPAVANLIGTAAVPVNPKLTPLGNYGGPTQTMPPLPGSPAIDAAAAAATQLDQRGFPRSRDGNGDSTPLPDIGAVEASLAGVTVPGDNVPGSLRAALTEAAAQPGADTVYFTASATPEATPYLTLTSEIHITDPAGVTLDASDRPTGLVIDGGTGTNRHFRIAGGTTAVFNRLRLYGGNGGGAEVNDIGHGGSIRNEGNLTLRECMIADCTSPSFGGALFNTGTGTLTLERSTLYGNSATSGGGAIQQVSPNLVTLTACTVANNRAGFEAGGINAPFGPAMLIHSTVSGNAVVNPGNGVGGLRGGGLTVRDSIVAGNADANFPGIPNISPGFTDQGTNLTSGDPKLATLGDYGGPAWTMPPMPGSHAIDAATTSTAATDQRGVARPLDGDDSGTTIRDLGAVEVPDPWIVNTPVDELNATSSDGAGFSLREAIRDAPAAASILFASNFNGEPADTITLSPTLGEITITKGLIINGGANPGGVTIDGGSGTNRIFYLPPGTGASLHRLTLSGGDAGGLIGAASGGAIFCQEATLALTDCAVIGNYAPNNGGAVRNLFGTLEMNRCLLAFNFGAEGGAVQIVTAPVTGPATSTATLTNCTVAANTATFRGGGVFNAAGRTTLLHCTVVGNAAPIGEGSGLASNGFDTVRTTVQNCLIARNSNASEVSFVQNPINTFLSLGGNLIGNGNAIPAFNQLRDAAAQTEANLRLGPLQDYGGPSLTVALRPGSPALSNATPSPVTTDQRGFGIVIGTKDSGAYEAGNFFLENFNVFAQEFLPHTATDPERARTFDFDGDGTNNQLEWLAFTGPANPASVFRVAAAQSGANINLTVPTIVGRTYTVQRSDDLTGSWINIPNSARAGTGSSELFSFPSTSPARRFFRIGISQP